MAIAADARTPGNQTLGGSGTGVTSVSWNHTLGTLTNGILVVSGSQDAGANSTGVNWDQAGTPVAFTGRKGSVTQGTTRAEIWYFKAPSPTGTKQIQVSWSGSHDGGFSSASYSGVDQTTIFNAASPQTNTAASGTSISLGVTTTSGELAIDAMVQDYAGSTSTLPAKGASQTYLGAGQTSATTIGIGASDQAASGTTTTMSWTVPNNGGLGIVGVSLLPAASSVTAAQEVGIFDQQRSSGMVGLQYR
jgi:hypothetical protein